MSWIDQGRQQHGWFDHGTSPHATPQDLRGRAFAMVHFATAEVPHHNNLPFPLEKTAEVLRTFAPFPGDGRLILRTAVLVIYRSKRGKCQLGR